MRKSLIINYLILWTILFLVSTIIVSAVQPFNIEIELPDTYKNVNPGNDIWFTIKLLNLANTQRVDVTLNYDILNSNGESIVHNSKTVAIETQASFVADLKLPATASPGDYVINVMVSSSLGDSYAKTSLVVSNPKTDLTLYYIVGSIVVLILLVIIIIKSKPLIEKLKMKIKIDRIVREKLKKK